MNTDLTKAQNDYAIYLPAVSTFYSNYIGRQRNEEYVPKSRFPSFLNNMEELNFFNTKQGLFQYNWALFSAGHAKLDIDKQGNAEAMFYTRDKNSILLADSGGFQIGKGVWTGRWNDPTDKEAEKRRSTVLKWLCHISDYSMCLDVPTWAYKNPEVADKIGIYSFEDAVNATKYNNKYFIKNGTNNTKFLNVLQGADQTDSDIWYEEMKEFCDPSKYDNHFRGWAMGDQNVQDIQVLLRRIVYMIHDGLLEEGKQDWMHFLGMGKTEWGVLLTDIQRAIRKHHNANFTISFDAASPFLSVVNGNVYYTNTTEDRKRWAFQTIHGADDRNWTTNNNSFNTIHEDFVDSPISKDLKISDICRYTPGETNKHGKLTNTSWDTFSYMLLMTHNVWAHINCIQDANRKYDSGNTPKLLIDERHYRVSFRDVLDQIFAVDTLSERLKIIEHHAKFLATIKGNRTKQINAEQQYNDKFEGDWEKLDFDMFRSKSKTTVDNSTFNNLFTS